MSDDFANAKAKWLLAKENYDKAIELYINIFNILEHQQIELNAAFAEFTVQQAKQVQSKKKVNFKEV